MEWIVDNANQVGVVVLLLSALYGLHRGWWVPSATYRECTTRRDILEQEVRETLVAKNAELEELRRMNRTRTRGES